MFEHVLQQLAYESLSASDLAILSQLMQLPEFQARRELLGRSPDPIPCEWDKWRDEFAAVGEGITQLTAEQADPSFQGKYNPEELARARRIAAIFGPPAYEFKKSWGCVVMWAITVREWRLFCLEPLCEEIRRNRRN